MAKSDNAKEAPGSLAVGDQVTYRLPDHWIKMRDKDTNPYRLAQVTDICNKDGKPCVDLLVFIGVADGGPNQDIFTTSDVPYDEELAPGTFSVGGTEKLPTLKGTLDSIADSKKKSSEKLKVKRPTDEASAPGQSHSEEKAKDPFGTNQMKSEQATPPDTDDEADDPVIVERPAKDSDKPVKEVGPGTGHRM